MGRNNYKRCSCIVVLKKSVKRCGCFQEQCSTPRACLSDWCWGNEFSKVIRRYDKDEGDEVIAGTQLPDRTWQKLKTYGRRTSPPRKSMACSTLKSGNGLTVFNGDSTQELTCGKNVHKFSRKQAKCLKIPAEREAT